MNRRNEQRNTFVKKQLTDTLITMLKEKKISEIRISKLTDRAGVSRVSFYRNFADLKDILQQESDRLIHQSKTLTSQPGTASYFSFFDFLRENREFYEILLDAGQTDILKDSIVKAADISADCPNTEAYLKAFWAYGLYGWILEWMRRGMVESSGEIFATLQKIQGN